MGHTIASVCFEVVSVRSHVNELTHRGSSAAHARLSAVTSRFRLSGLTGGSRGAVAGLLIGVVGIALVTALFTLFGQSAPTTIPALLLLVPIAAASVMSGWRLAVPLAVVAAFMYALAFIPPIGQVRIGLTEDVFVLITFVVVAVLVGLLKSHATPPGDRALLDDGRTALLRGVSHDLRSPLTTIRAISSDLLVGGEYYDDGTRHRLLGRVVDESDRLDRIVGNLLSVSRVQAGALNPNREPESVAMLVQRCIGRLNRDGSHRVLTDIPEDLADVSADAVQIDQVLTNLVENAMRHTPAGAVVTVSARQVADRVEIAVRDDGPGFSPDALDHLYRPFSTVSRKIDGGIGGGNDQSTGLGLVVSKAIVEAHGGTILVRDEPGPGACVSFTLPVEQPVHADSRHRG